MQSPRAPRAPVPQVGFDPPKPAPRQSHRTETELGGQACVFARTTRTAPGFGLFARLATAHHPPRLEAAARSGVEGLRLRCSMGYIAC